MKPVRILLLPGWQDAGPGHWLTRWQALHGFERVVQDDWWWPRRGDWMVRLEDTLLADERPAVLVAHGLGCHLVAAWAAHSQQRHRVTAALLVAPPDLQRTDAPPQWQAWARLAPQALPFASSAVLSADDPASSASHSLRTAAAWGSEIHRQGAAGGLDGHSGLGDWPEGLALLQALLLRAGLAASPAPR